MRVEVTLVWVYKIGYIIIWSIILVTGGQKSRNIYSTTVYNSYNNNNYLYCGYRKVILLTVLVLWLHNLTACKTENIISRATRVSNDILRFTALERVQDPIRDKAASSTIILYEWWHNILINIETLYFSYYYH